jgi:heat-inducible transcriptional repressor
MSSKLSQSAPSGAGKKQDAPDERAQHLLRVLIGRYIREGQPVGSRALSHDSGLDVSPATVRNIMADLEEMGFLASPHTSAGRVPTNKGYRFFVDTLVKLTPPRGEELLLVQESLRETAADPQALAATIANLLSSFTKLAGVVTVPKRAHLSLRQIEFLPLSGRRVLAILVVNDREVQNKIVEVARDFTPEELRRAGNYLTEQLGGRDLYQVRHGLLKKLQETRASLNELMLDAIAMVEKVLPADEPPAEYVMTGETNLMALEDLADLEKLRELFEAFSRQRDILHLLDRSMHVEGVQIFIGQESGYRLLDDCSVVTAPYAADEDTMGVLAVIGPTRMAYERVIPIVDVTAKLIGSALKSENWPPFR